MDIKKIKIIGCIGTFAACFLIHFLYQIIPNPLISIIAPVNESIWEHMKMIYTSYMIYGIIDYVLLKKHPINNFIFQLFFVPLLGIIIYLIAYLPIHSIIGENMIFNISLLAVIVIIEQLISYLLLKEKNIKCGKIIGIIGILVVYSIFGYLTYHPVKNYVFFDTHNSKYGINIYAK